MSTPPYAVYPTVHGWRIDVTVQVGWCETNQQHRSGSTGSRHGGDVGTNILPDQQRPTFELMKYAALLKPECAVCSMTIGSRPIWGGVARALLRAEHRLSGLTAVWISVGDTLSNQDQNNETLRGGNT